MALLAKMLYPYYIIFTVTRRNKGMEDGTDIILLCTSKQDLNERLS